MNLLLENHDEEVDKNQDELTTKDFDVAHLEKKMTINVGASF